LATSRIAALAAVLAALTALWGAGTAGARNPPNGNDPCSRAGRDTCGTTGIGFYDTYRYGIRWFGDYKNVATGQGRAFCIDLGYWYPSASYHYELESAPGLHNSAGQDVLLVNRQKLAYAVWAFGRSTNPDRQAAVMLYVHSLMGDARPGEADPRAINPKVASDYATIAHDASVLHGPYRITGSTSGELRVGQETRATVRVLSATGAAVPNVTLSLSSSGATGAPATVTTDAQGVARLTLRPTTAGAVTVSVKADGLASPLPAVYRASTPQAAPNAQRLVVPTSQEVSGTVVAHVAKGHIAVSSAATPTQLVVGHVVRDKVTISGATEDWHGTVTVSIDGPFPAESETRCGSSVWHGTFTANGPGTYTTPVATVAKPGWYVFALGVPGDDANVGVRSSCADPAERFFAQTQPTLTTEVSSDKVAVGSPVFDRLTVGSLGGTPVTATVDLYGPFASDTAIVCSGTPIWSGSVPLTRNGSFQTDSFTPTVPGVYSYQATIGSTALVRGTTGACGEAGETTMVPAAPAVVTRASATATRPGSQISDSLTVTGTGALTVTVKVDLFGPFMTRTGIGCTGPPVSTETVTTKGDGTYATRPVTIDKVGYYTFRESVAGSPGKCAETAETTLVAAKPTVTTEVSADVVRPGSAISDRIVVSGLGRTQAAVPIQLYGPFSTKAAIKCSGKPYWQGRVTAQGDGELRSPAVRISSAGFYTFHESLVAREYVLGATTTCAEIPETSLGAPAIITGRGDRTHTIAVSTHTPDAPVRITIASLGIDAPILPSAIDLKQGVLAVPSDIHRTGWWVDGATPHSSSGSIVIAGHVDSASAGAGAFFPLKQAKAGGIVVLTSADGRKKSYRVVSVKRMLKANLPTDIWSQRSPSRLFVVTCGGPFDPVTRHYRDNIVVTAVPA
jgi:Sortase domain/Bacterial Ig-like domain (group 1)